MRGIAGLILLGGESRRFGYAKHQAVLGGRSLLARAISNLDAQTWPVALATGATANPPDDPAASGLPCLDDDRHAGKGPLAGIRAGLLWMKTEPRMPEWLFSLPVDVPFVSERLATDLLAAAAAANAGAAYAASAERHHAAIAIWHRRALPILDEILAGEGAPVMAAHDRLGSVSLDVPDAASLLNINTPEDLAQAEALLREAD